MTFLDILYLSLRNLREAKLRATLTTMGVVVGVAVIVSDLFDWACSATRLALKEIELFNGSQSSSKFRQHSLAGL